MSLVAGGNWALLALRGTNGANGANGTNGTNGTNGAAATVSVGTVATGAPGTPASVNEFGHRQRGRAQFHHPAGSHGRNWTARPTASQPTGASPAGIPYTFSAMMLNQIGEAVNPVSGASSTGLGAQFRDSPH